MNNDIKGFGRYWSIAVVLVTVLAIIAAGWGLTERRQKEQMGLQLEAAYQNSFFSMIEHVENLELLLSKSLVSATPARQALILTRVYAEASAAQEALSRLPASVNLQRSQQFLAQLGDFAYMMADKLAVGQAPKAEDWDNLARLKSQAGQWMKQLNQVRRDVTQGKMQWTATAASPALMWASVLPNPGPAPSGIGSHLSELDRELQEAPTLIYDGPFSEQNLRPEPKTRLGAVVSREKAAEAAVNFITRSDSKQREMPWEAIPQGEAKAPIDIYSFELRPAGRTSAAGSDSPPIYVEVSKEGGRVISFLAYHTPTANDGLSADDAMEKARSYLADRGMKEFVPTGWVKESGRITFSFTRTQVVDGEAVVIYPEMVKVTVATGDGRIVGYDARAYWLNRNPRRDFPDRSQRVITMDDARDMVNPLLDVLEVRPAVIPLPSGNEAFVYEVLASLEDDRFLLYYNVTNGREETVLRVVESEDSRLTF